MPINFIPNDPMATNGPPLRRQTAHANRPAGSAGFTWVAHAPSAPFPPGTPDFLFWQSREAALRAMASYEALTGRRVSRWARSPDPKRLELSPNDGQDLNAYYDGRGLRFFEYTTGSKTTYSGASTDVVAHECGHALLDQLRPDLWSSSYIETGAFHEAFGDCTALLTAFADAGIRSLVRTRLRKANFVEATAEDLSDGVRRALGAQHPAAEPRHALNGFRWALPSTLPSSGPPRTLTAEIHSFARIFSGCFYDTILNILRARLGATTPTSAQLRQAVQTAGRLLIGAAADAPESARFFQAVGRTMILADQQLYGGANRVAIHDAFDRHGIALGSAAMLSPVAALAGRPSGSGRGEGRVLVTPAALADLRHRIGAHTRALLTIQRTSICGRPLLRATHHREVPLAALDRRLRGVIAVVPESTLIGSHDRTVAILGGLPEPTGSVQEVTAFVRTLLAADRIAFEATQARSGIPSQRRKDERKRLPTHAIRSVRGKRMLERVRFACGGGEME
jgi:hypothetical protein